MLATCQDMNGSEKLIFDWISEICNYFKIKIFKLFILIVILNPGPQIYMN